MRSTERYQGRNQRAAPLSQAQQQERLSLILAKGQKQGGFLDPWEADEVRQLASALNVDTLVIESIPLNESEPKGEDMTATSSVNLVERIWSEGGVVVAAVYDSDAGKYLYKTVSGKKHFLRRPPSIAFDEVVIAKAKELGATHIMVLDKEDGTVYKCSVTQFEAGALHLDRGFGKQMALPMGKWNQPEAEEAKPDAQPSLF